MLQGINFTSSICNQTINRLRTVQSNPKKVSTDSSFRSQINSIKNEQVIEGITDKYNQAALSLSCNWLSTDEMEDLIVGMCVNDNDPNSRALAAIAAKLTQQHYAQFYNFENVSEKLSDIRNLAETTDYSSMSDAEKFTTIYERYTEAFGDFWKADAIQYPGNPQSDRNKIRQQFFSELRTVFGSMDKAVEANKVARYGNMSDADIRAEIESKYPPMDKITLREFHYMVWEMNSVGVDGGLNSVLYNATTYIEYCESGVPPWLIREELLDQPLDLQHVCNTYNSMLYARSVTSAAGGTLHELFDVSFDARGNAYSNSSSSIDFEALIEQIIQSFKKRTEPDYTEWFVSH